LEDFQTYSVAMKQRRRGCLVVAVMVRVVVAVMVRVAAEMVQVAVELVQVAAEMVQVAAVVSPSVAEQQGNLERS
jgi:hypothetical protein